MGIIDDVVVCRIAHTLWTVNTRTLYNTVTTESGMSESGGVLVHRDGARKAHPRLALGLAGITLLSPTTMFSSNSRPPSQHVQSVNVIKHASYFSSIDEELRDCKRVQRQGQEEDLREALSRMMTRVEEMVRYHWKHSPFPSCCNLEVSC